MNKVELYGGKASLEQCGAPLSFWPWGLAHFAQSRNIYPTQGREDTPYERKIKKGAFQGIRAPFMARIRFRQLKSKE